MAVLFRGFLYAVSILIILCSRYIAIVFYADALYCVLSPVLHQFRVLGAKLVVGLIPAFFQLWLCIPKSQVFVISGCALLSSRRHVIELFSYIGNWLFSIRSCVLLFTFNMVTSNTFHLPLTWNQLQSVIVPLSNFVAVTQRSFSGETIPAEWLVGRKRYLRLGVPILLRVTVMLLITRHIRGSIAPVTDNHELSTGHFSAACEARTVIRASEQLDSHCTDFSGKPLLCRKLDQVRHFNQFVMPALKHATYEEVRKRMSQAGLDGVHWQVGHAIPDPSKKTFRDPEDFGWNLFCQGASDNRRLGHRLVSCAEAVHWNAFHVTCSPS